MREKYYSLAEKVRLISQTNRAKFISSPDSIFHDCSNKLKTFQTLSLSLLGGIPSLHLWIRTWKDVSLAKVNLMLNFITAPDLLKSAKEKRDSRRGPDLTT